MGLQRVGRGSNEGLSAALGPETIALGFRGFARDAGGCVSILRAPNCSLGDYDVDDLTVLHIAFDNQGGRRRPFNRCLEKCPTTSPRRFSLADTASDSDI